MTLIDTRGRPLESAKAGPVTYSGQAAAFAFDQPMWRASTNPWRFFREAQQLYHTNPWVNLAERTISAKVAGLDWHLEDAADEEITDKSPAPFLEARDLIEKPQMALTGRKQQTRRDLWSLTSRHIGLCGNAFWFLDQLDLLAARPASIMYVNPARIAPVEDRAGNLIGWMLDGSSFDASDGTPLEIPELLHFTLDPPDWGHFGVGIVEAFLGKAFFSTVTDRHAAGVVSSGGRLAGMLMPKAGVTMEPDAWESLKRDYRAIVGDPDAAKKMQILKQAMDFTPTSANPQQLDLAKLMDQSRDDILAGWGVPVSQVGIATAAGLNGGATKGFDEAILMQGAVHARVVSIRETIQFQLLDRWKAAGVALELEIEEPEFDDQTPQFDLAVKARELPLTNAQRLALIGEEPTGDDAIDNAIMLPSTYTTWAVVGAAAIPVPIVPVAAPSVPVEPAALLPTMGKARRIRGPLLSQRHAVDTRVVPAVKRSVAAVLAEMRTEIAGKVKRNAAHLARRPTDVDSWWNAAKWNVALTKALAPHVSGVALTVTTEIDKVLGTGKAAPVWAEPIYARLLKRVGLRVTGLLDTTRDAVLSVIQATVRQGIDDGLGAAQMGDVLESALNDAATFNEYRAEMIARTETMAVYNAAALDSYREFGMEQVQAIDGDGDPECAARDGQVFTLDEAAAIEDHPNGTLDWTPYFPEEA